MKNSFLFECKNFVVALLALVESAKKRKREREREREREGKTKVPRNKTHAHSYCGQKM